ncbi:MAG: T9SS type A sorting domain-containing protein, partial [Bacteroidia bacterium]|nr:T9SS type A sorting domain-containing protein [Bacteroidia bacterium]
FDSNLNITKFRYYKLADSSFDNNCFAMVYIDSNEVNFLSLGSNRNPNSKNSDVQACVMITKNLDDNKPYKIINDTLNYSLGYNLIKLNDNRYAISSIFYPDLKKQFLYYGQNFIIDSNINIIQSVFENPGMESSETRNLLRTYDDNLISIGSKSKDDNSADIFCYKYNPDLTPFIKKNIIKNYDTLCSQVLTTSTTILPDPQIIYLYKDSFLSKLNKINPGNPDIKIFPNPATDKINIDSDGGYFLDVFDITGRKIFQGENITELTLPKGIYFLHFQKDDTVFIRKVIFTGN